MHAKFKLFGSALVIYSSFSFSGFTFYSLFCILFLLLSPSPSFMRSNGLHFLAYVAENLTKTSPCIQNQWKYILKSNTKENCAVLTKGKNVVANKFHCALFQNAISRFRFHSYSTRNGSVRFATRFFTLLFILVFLCFSFVCASERSFFSFQNEFYYAVKREMPLPAPELLSSSMLQIMTKLQLLKDTKWN